MSDLPVFIFDCISIEPPIPFDEFRAKADDWYRIQPSPTDPRCEGRLIHCGNVALHWADWEGANHIGGICGPDAEAKPHRVEGLGDALRRIRDDFGTAPDGTRRTFSGVLGIEWGEREMIAYFDQEREPVLGTPPLPEWLTAPAS